MTDDAINRQVLWYRLDAVLGRGGFGVTYAATDTNLGRSVAIKEYYPHGHARRHSDQSVAALDNPDSEETFEWGLERFLDEARTLVSIDHPNVVRAHTVFEAFGTAFIVMELIEGPSLAELINAQGFNAQDELLKVGLPLLDALACIHAAGYIHRDIKPTNILLKDAKTPVLLDFGSAREAPRSGTADLTSLVTRGYSPWEQYDADTGIAQGPWTDIYACAGVFYKAITGEAPADALKRSISRSNGGSDIFRAAVARHGTDYSQRFLGAIDCALAFQAVDRPQSVREWLRLFPEPTFDIELPHAGLAFTNGKAQSTGNTERTAQPLGDDRFAETFVEDELPDAQTEELSLDDLSVLLIDDEPWVRNLAARVISNLGMRDICQAGSGAEALAMIDAGDSMPDVIISDLNMPEMDGVEFLEHLGKRDIPAALILVSCEDTRILEAAYELARARNLGILGTLSKPMRPQAIRELLHGGAHIIAAARERQSLRITRNDLSDALADGAFQMFYQPVVKATSREITGIEAFARLAHPDHGLLQPEQFAPLLSRYGLMHELTSLAIEAALAEVGALYAEGFPLSVVINIPGSSARTLDLPELLMEYVVREGVDPRGVTLDFSAAEVADEALVPLPVLTRLRLRGVGIGVDRCVADSLDNQTVRAVPATVYRLHPDLCVGVVDRPDAGAAVERIASIAAEREVELAAVGAESSQDAGFLQVRGCATLQGRFFSDALSTGELRRLLRETQR
ncbi:MAG: EAL domain-containing protein [Pseudomonadota bacterium]